MSEGVAEPEQTGARGRFSPRRAAFSRTPAWHPEQPRLELPVELVPFADIIDAAVLEAAARRALRLGVGGDEVLRCAGILTPDEIAAGIAEKLGIAVDSLDRSYSPFSLDAARTGVLSHGERGRTSFTVAARGTGIRRLTEWIAANPHARDILRIVAPERLAEHVRTIAARELAHEAVEGLRTRHPDLSAKRKGFVPLHALAIALCAVSAGAAFLIPDAGTIAAEYFLAFCFIAWTCLRGAACAVPRPSGRRAEIPERFLPIYTIIVPLRHEAAVAAKLVGALKRIRYPREKLDIKILLEEDDHETRAAIAALKLHAPFEIIAPPKTGPQTKPKALAAALPFARGSFVTIYDAEDEPEPDQLRKAVAAFMAGPSDLACVQAKLAIFNPTDGWFSRQFAAEYAGQFEVFLPALARLGLPLPLGGTSNHFVTQILREVGGWDPYNVTEDADLGMRLARFGYRSETIDSTTWEEAPVNRGQWIRQRTRWMKGWMQTWIVHMRYPLRLWRDLGPRGFFSLQLLIGGSLLSALVHPVFMVLVAGDAISGELFAHGETIEHSLRKGLAIAVLVTGYLSTALLGIAGLKRRGMLGLAWVLATVPLYWLFLSAAAWRATWHLIVARYQWEKTEHGLARPAARPREPRGATASARTRPVREFVASRRTGSARRE